MVSKVSICSNALLMLGADPINSLADTSDQAVLCKNLYPVTRDSVLRAHPWNCAIKRVVLAPNATAPLFDYANSFNLPSDWLRTLSVGEDGSAIDYVSEGRQLLSDESSLSLRYVFRNEDENTWHAGLVEAVTLAMAHRLAYPVTSSTSMMDSKMNELQMFLKRARAEDGQEDPPETMGDFPLLASRLSRR